MNPAIQATRTVLKTNWFSVDALYHGLNSQQQPYYRITCSDAVVIMAITAEEQILLVRPFQPVLEETFLEVPAGNIDENETPLEAANRELVEETGFMCDEMHHVCSLRMYSSRMNNKVYGFLGMGAHSICEQAPGDKCIDVLLVGKNEFEHTILCDQFQDASGLSVYMAGKIRSLV